MLTPPAPLDAALDPAAARGYARRAQLTMAAHSIRLPDAALATFDRWLAALPAADVPLELGAAVRADLGALLVTADAEIPALFPLIENLIAGARSPDEERARLLAAGEALAPARAGAWLRASTGPGGDEVDAGWRLGPALPLGILAAHLPTTAVVDRALTWARGHGIATCALLRSLGAGSTALEVEVTDPVAVEALLAATRARVDADLLAAAGGVTRVRGAELVFTPTGLAAVTLRVACDDHAAMVRALDAAGASAALDRERATVDAALSEDGPRYLAVVTDATGTSLELAYPAIPVLPTEA